VAKNEEGEPELQINARVKNSGKWGKWSGGGAIYCLGLVGSVVYWMQAAAGFGAVVTGILKSLVWPAYIVYKLLENFYGAVR
jgi:hypothetical protein